MARFGRCTITSGNLNIRSTASTNGIILFTIKKDEVVTITGNVTNNFYPISHPNGTGYASADYLTEILGNGSSTGTVTLSSGSLNVRTGPDATYTVAFSLSNGASVYIYASLNGWYLVKNTASTVSGWCSDTYITVSGTNPNPGGDVPNSDFYSLGKLVSVSKDGLSLPGQSVYSFPKSASEKVSDHFRISEFRCKCPTSSCSVACGCSEILIDYKLIILLEKIRKAFGDLPMNPHSGYRCQKHNTHAKGAANSQHMYGKAFDFTINFSGLTASQAATRIYNTLNSWTDVKGLGIYNDNTIHVDVREGSSARWDYRT